jgi:ATP-dependent protease HslVU (ClpYQ) peptidase subunit
MTCIAAIALPSGETWVGGDSAGTNTSSQQTIHVDPKVFFVRNESGDEFLFGCSTSFRMMQLLQYVFKPPRYDGGDLHRYMVAEFVEAVRSVLKSGGFARKEAEREQGGKFLVGFRGHLFLIDSDYQVAEANCGYNAIGSGGDLAIGSLYTTEKQDISPEKRLTIALQAAAYHNSDVREPFIIRHLVPAPSLIIEPINTNEKVIIQETAQ